MYYAFYKLCYYCFKSCTKIPVVEVRNRNFINFSKLNTNLVSQPRKNLDSLSVQGDFNDCKLLYLYGEYLKGKTQDYLNIFDDLIYGHFDIQCVQDCQAHQKNNRTASA